MGNKTRKDTFFRRSSRTIILSLVAVFVLSVIAAGTLAWHDKAQHKTNILEGKHQLLSSAVNILLSKSVSNADGSVLTPTQTEIEFEFVVNFFRIRDDGTPVPETEAFHYSIDGGAAQEIRSGGIISFKPGQSVRVMDLPNGIYYRFYELPVAGYIPAVGEYVGALSAADDLIVLPLFNVCGIDPENSPGNLVISKTVIGKDADANKDFDFTVTFLGDGAPPSPQTITLKDGESYTFTGIPAGIAYRVCETDYRADGYFAQFSEASGIIAYNSTSELKFKNTYPLRGNGPPDPPPKENVKVTISKSVEGDPPPEELGRKFSFRLFVDGIPHEFRLSAGETAEYTIPKGAAYELVEDDYTINGYTQVAVANERGTAGDEDIAIAKVNIYRPKTPEPPGDGSFDTITIEGQKTWIHGANPPSGQPDSMTVYVMDGRYVAKRKVITGADGWKWQFVLPKYDAGGREIQYTVEEVNIPGYTGIVDGWNITNRFRGAETPASPPGNKGDAAGQPATGDETSVDFWLSLLIASTICLIVLQILALRGLKRIRR